MHRLSRPDPPEPPAAKCLFLPPGDSLQGISRLYEECQLPDHFSTENMASNYPHQFCTLRANVTLPLLIKLFKHSSDLFTHLRTTGRAEKSMQEIRQLIIALKARDEDAASAICILHVDNAAQAALAVLRKQQQTALPVE